MVHTQYRLQIKRIHNKHVCRGARVLLTAEPGGKLWRRAIDTSLRHATSVQQVLDETLSIIPDEVLDKPPSEIAPSEDILQHPVDLAILPKQGSGYLASDPPADPYLINKP